MAYNRREFLAAGGVVAVAALASQAEALPLSGARATLTIYRFSARGRRASRAAKAFCANLRFKTKHAALTYPPPHPRFNGRLVGIPVNLNEFHRLFVSRHEHVADLRHLRNVTIIGV